MFSSVIVQTNKEHKSNLLEMWCQHYCSFSEIANVWFADSYYTVASQKVAVQTASCMHFTIAGSWRDFGLRSPQSDSIRLPFDRSVQVSTEWTWWLIHMCVMTHPYVCHDSFICVTWLIHMCVMTHSYVWHVYICVMTHSYVWHESFICVTWIIHMCVMTYSYVCHDSFICVTWLIHMCVMTHSYVWHVHMCVMTHSYVWHDSFKKKNRRERLLRIRVPTALQTPLTPYVAPERVRACEWVRGGVSGLGRGMGVWGVR